jgi:hypothetical protein
MFPLSLMQTAATQAAGKNIWIRRSCFHHFNHLTIEHNNRAILRAFKIPISAKKTLHRWMRIFFDENAIGPLKGWPDVHFLGFYCKYVHVLNCTTTSLVTTQKTRTQLNHKTEGKTVN